MTFLKTQSMTAAMVVAGGVVTAETTLILGEAGLNRGAALQWFADELTERSAGGMNVDIQWRSGHGACDCGILSLENISLWNRRPDSEQI